MTSVDQILSSRYRIERMLGQGGMSDVFRAVDMTTGESVAVKVVRSADPDLARRLAQEAKALARLEHPGLVRFLDAGVHDEQAFLVMELVEGPTLAERLRKGPLSPARTAMLGRTLSDALAYVHARGIVHRDVKPANILLGPRSRVRLADFGIARMVDASSLTVTGTTLGTASYMAPEQLEHHVVGTAADVWSLGVIVLECLTGQRVFEGTAPEVVARRLAGPVPLPRDLPPPWRLVLEGMLAPVPERRPSAAHVAGLLSAAPFAEPWERDEPTTDALATAVAPAPGATGNGQRTPADGAAAGLGATAALARDEHAGTLVATRPPAPPPDAPGTPHRRRAAWIALAVAVIVAAGVSAWALSPQGAAPHHRQSPPTTVSTSTTTPPSTTSSTPTTTLPTASTASAALVRDAQAGVAAGSLSAGASKTILDELNQALSASSSGDHNQVSTAIGSMEATIAKEVQAGRMPPAEASTLEGDVAVLATALGVSTSATTTPTGTTGNTGNTGNTGAGTTTTAPPPRGGNRGNGH